MADEYICKADVLNLPQNIERNLKGEIVERSVDVGAIEALPAADVVKVRHAKDVYKQYNKHHCEFMCSLCGGWIGVIEGGDCDFNYCPNCGAKMDGEE